MRGVTAALLLVAAGCSADRVTSADPVLAVAEEGWSGDTLAVRSASFIGADTVPVVTVGADTLVTWRGGLDTALVLLPDTAGDVELAVRLHSGGIAFATVTVHGMRSAGPGPVEGYGRAPYPFPWPDAGSPTALAIHNGRLVLVDYHTDTYTALTADTDLWVGAYGQQFPNPVPSATDRRLVSVSHGTGPLEAVPIAADAPAPDSGPPNAGLTQIHLSRGNWLVSYKNQGLQLITRSPAGALVFAAKVEGSYVVSPRGDRVVPTQTIGGLFAFEPTAPAFVYRVGTYAGGAAFSEGGDTLFAVVNDSGPVHLVALDATTGARLREVPVWSGELEVVVDPGRPWLYLVGVEGGFVSGHIAVYVYDRASFARIATLVVPDSAVPPNSSAHLAGMYVPILDPVRRALYVTMNYFVDPQFVFHFDLMR